MKLLLLAFVMLGCIAVNAQTAQDHFRDGLAKQKAKNFKGAIKDYTAAIGMIDNYRDAWYNKASCEAALKDYDAAFADFGKVIELDPNYAKGYFARANVLISQDKHQEAMPDLNKAVKLDYRLPDLLCTRGQVRGEAGDKVGACNDFHKAKLLGDTNADEFIAQICDSAATEKK